MPPGQDPWDQLASGQQPDPWDELFGAPLYSPEPAPPEESGGGFGAALAAPFKAFGRGLNIGATSTVPQLAGNVMETLGDLGMPAGEILGPGMEEYGERRGEELAERYGEGPGFRDAPIEWIAENLGRAVPTAVPAIAAAAGAGPAGALAVGAAMGAGDIRGELEDAGMDPSSPEALALTLGGAPVYGAADMLMPARVGGAITKGVAKKGFGPVFQSALRAGMEEGVAEGTQSLVSQGAAAIGTGQEVDWARVGEEAARGAAAGPFFGAGGQVVASRRPALREPATEGPQQATEPDVAIPDPWEELEAQEAQRTAQEPPVDRPAPDAKPTPEPDPFAGFAEGIEGAEAGAPARPEALPGEDAADGAEQPPAPSFHGKRDGETEVPKGAQESAPEWTQTPSIVDPGRKAGKSQESVFPGDDRKVKTEYQVMEAGQGVASHTSGYAQRAEGEFPAEIQGRAYHGPRGQQAREHTEMIVTRFDPNRALDTTLSVAEGPPVVTENGIVVAGNGRMIAQQRLYESRPDAGQALKETIIERANEFGIDPEQVARMERPVLVRRIADPGVDVTDVTTLRELNASSDQPIGKTKDPISEAATRAASFRAADTALEHFATTAEPDATIRSYLGSKAGRDFLTALVDDGVISAGERARYADATTGSVTDEGKQLVERMFYVAALGDPETVSRAPASALRKLDTSLPAIIRADRVGGDWQIGETVREALDFLAGERASGMTREDYLSQPDFLGQTPEPSTTVMSMADFLAKKKGDVRDAFRSYANKAEAFARQSQSDDLFGFEPEGPSDAQGFYREAALEPRPSFFEQDNPAAQAQLDVFGFVAEPTARAERRHEGQENIFGDRNPELAEGWESLGQVNDRFAYRDPQGNTWLAPTDELVQVTGKPKDARLASGVEQPDAPPSFFTPVDEDPVGSGNLFLEPAQPSAGSSVFGLSPTTSPERVPSSGMPRASSADLEAGGIRMNEPTEAPPRTQPSVPRQTSTEDVSPSDTRRNIEPPSREAGSTTFSTALSFNEQGNGVVQRIDDLGELQQTAQELLEPYREAIQQAARQVPGVQVFGARVKAGERLAEKVEQRGGPTALGDILGGRVWVDSIEAGDRVVMAMERQGWRRPPWGEESDESFFDERKGGYRARHVQLVDPDGNLAVEFQVVPREIGEVQEETHKLYDIFRDETVPEPERLEAKRQSRAIFDKAWAQFIERMVRETGVPAGHPLRQWAQGYPSLATRTEPGDPPADIADYANLPLYQNRLRESYEGGHSSRTEPQTAPVPPVGAWFVDDSIRLLDGREVAQVAELDVDNIEISEYTSPPKYQDVEQYAQWWMEGSEPPPIQVIQTARGTLKTLDHRRLLAAKLAGKDKIKAIVGWATKSDRTGNPVVGLTFELVEKGKRPLPVADVQPEATIHKDNAKWLNKTRRHGGTLWPAGVHPLAPVDDPAPSGTLGLAPTAQLSEQLRDAGEFREGTAAEAPKATEIVRDLQKVLHEHLQGVKVAEGGKRIFRKALAVVTPKSQVVRSRSLSDVAAIGHEFGHLMQKLLLGSAGDGEISNEQLQGLPGAIRGELEDMARGISDQSLVEGWAEFWRRYIDNPESLADGAPNARDWIESRLEAHPGVRNAWQDAREQWAVHRDASPQARLRSHVSVGESDPAALSIDDKWMRFRTNILDDFEAIRKVVDHVRKRTGEELSVDEDAETLARLTRGSAGIADMFIGERKGDGYVGGAVEFGTGERIGKSLAEILEPVTDRLEDFRDYMIARRARELHRRNLMTGIRDEDVEWTLNELEGKWGEEFKETFDDLQDYNGALLQYLADSGVISEDSLVEIQKTNRDYVPFYRVHEGKKGGIGGGSGFGTLWSPVKRLKGSGRDIIDPLESTIKNTYSYVQLAHKQRVSTALAALAEKEGVGDLLEELLVPMKPTQFTVGEVAKDLEESVPGFADLVEKIKSQGGDNPSDDMLAIFRPGDFLGKTNTISVLKEGKRQWYEVDPELYKSLEGLETEQLDGWVRWLAKPARTLRAGATLAPEFLIRNPLRDQVMAFVQSEHGYRPFWDLARGVVEYVKRGDAYEDFMVSGAHNGTMLGLDRDSQQRNLKKLLDSGGVPNVVKNPLDILRALSETMESGTRMGEFMRAREQGKSLEEAGSAAREISTDFARHGAKTTALRSLAAFWNARLQGYDTLARAAKRAPLQFAAKAFSAITLPSLMEYFAYRDDDEYWEIPQWQRDIFWVARVGDQWLRIPKPFELGLIFGTMPIRILSALDGSPGGSEETRRFFEDTLSKEVTSIGPTPTAVMPLVENLTNWSFFMQRPITPRSEQDVRAREQGDERTSEVAKMLARWSPGPEGISPRAIDNLLYAWTGGLGRIATHTVDETVELVTGAPPRPTRTPSDIPGVRGLTVRTPGLSSESVERLYRELGKARTARSTLRHFRREGQREKWEKEARDPEQAELRALAPRFERAADAIATIRSRVEMIRRDERMSPAEKRDRIDTLGDRAIEVARKALGK